MPVEVILNSHELVIAGTCGLMRHVSALRSGNRNFNGMSDELPGWNAHIEGACGELAVAKQLGVYWPARVNNYHGADLADNIQVRTRSKHSYDLIVRESDDPEHVFVLVTGMAPRFLVHGCIKGVDARRPEWLQEYGDRPKAWFVPRESLTGIALFSAGQPNSRDDNKDGVNP